MNLIDVMHAAFEDELEKIALEAPLTSAATGVAKINAAGLAPLQPMQAAKKLPMAGLGKILKHAGVGMVRIGRKPIGVERLLERDAEENAVDMDIDGDEVEKEAFISGRDAVVIGGTLLAANEVRKRKRDMDVGRQMRLQNQGMGTF